MKLPCADSPCLNGGLCVNLNDADYECECLSIYNGTNCEGKCDSTAFNLYFSKSSRHVLFLLV